MKTRAPRLRLVLAGALSTVFLGSGATHALPPGGASPDTPGTSGTISQRSLTPGATITFRISGFPASEVVSVKIDDGEFCSAKGVHGACVVHQQKSSKDGSMSGSFALPTDLAPGKHWLRFLASSEMKDADGNYLGVKPYSLSGDTMFTITAAGQSSGGAGAASGSPKSGAPGKSAAAPSAGSSSTTMPGSSAGATVPGAGGAAASMTAPEQTQDVVPGALRVPAVALSQSSPAMGVEFDAAAPEAEAAATLASSSVEQDERFPWVGAAVLALCLGFGAALLLRGRGVRRA